MSVMIAWANTHSVKGGENDETIAKKYGLTVAQLHKLNPKVNWNKLQIGQSVVVSASKPVAKPAAKPAAKPQMVKTTKSVEIIKTDVIVRSGPGTSFDKVTMVTKGRTAGLIESRSGWFKIQFSGGTVGWVRADMAKVVGATAKPAVSTQPKEPTKPVVASKTGTEGSVEIVKTDPKVVQRDEKKVDPPTGGSAIEPMPLQVQIAKDDVIVRSGPSTSKSKVVTVSKGRIADVLARQNGWFKVKFSGGTIGWVRNDMTAAPGSVDLQAKSVESSDPGKAGSLLETARDQMGVRYRYGGTSRAGFDCSGFVQYVFSKHGIKLPRTALQMSGVGQKVGRDQLQPGDQVFFITVGRRVSHVGIYIGGGRFIHASSGGGKVQINSLGENYYNKRYAGARRQPGLKGLKIVEDAKKEEGQKAIPEGPAFNDNEG